MKNRLRNVLALALFPQILLILYLRNHPGWVETYYSHGLYPHISGFFRTLYGWIPFSVGDCLYTLLILSLGFYIGKNHRRLRQEPLSFLRNILLVFSIAYGTFHLLWGLNYYRQPLARTLDLEAKYRPEELEELTRRFILVTNQMQLAITGDSLIPVRWPYERETIMDKTLEGYDSLRITYPFLEYRGPSLKKSLFSRMLTYMGYGGYLNPFTNEAQVNARIPLFRFPVICGHEIGHQLGYSAENETNFIGYLVTATHPDPYFRYSAYAYAASYCLAEIHARDSLASRRLYQDFHPGVRKNFDELEAFWTQYENPMEPYFKKAFNTFLKANNQAEGIRSYNRIVSLLVAYHRKHPM